MPARTAIVVPFFNEEKRIDGARLLAMVKDPAHANVDLVFVDDGSRDRTAALLEDLAARSGGRAELVRLEQNGGKAEAVRAGMLREVERGAGIVGYADADLSTPPEEILRMLGILESRSDLDVVIGSRVLMIGRRIERRASRHYLGRVFATLAANILRTPFYDTQCGAKLFRVNAALEAALSRPFTSRWAFDVELLGRLLIGTREAPAIPLARVREIPLEQWVDEPGSKLHPAAMAKALVDMAAIELELERLRKEARRRSA